MLYRVCSLMLQGIILSLSLFYVYALIGVTSKPSNQQVKLVFHYELSALFNEQTLINDAAYKRKISKLLKPKETLVFGEILVVSEMGETARKSVWLGYLDENSLNIASHFSMELPSGSYQFYWLLEHKGKQYSARSSYAITEKNTYIELAAKPILGPIVLSPYELKKLAIYNKQYVKSGRYISIWQNGEVLNFKAKADFQKAQFYLNTSNFSKSKYTNPEHGNHVSKLKDAK